MTGIMRHNGRRNSFACIEKYKMIFAFRAFGGGVLRGGVFLVERADSATDTYAAHIFKRIR